MKVLTKKTAARMKVSDYDKPLCNWAFSLISGQHLCYNGNFN